MVGPLFPGGITPQLGIVDAERSSACGDRFMVSHRVSSQPQSTIELASVELQLW